MPVQRLPFPGPLDKNLLDVIVKQGAVELWNGYLDPTGAVYKRPGLLLNQTISGINLGVEGLYWWKSKDVFVLIGDGLFFTTENLINNFTQRNSVFETLQKGLVQFADTGYWLYVASTSGRLLGWNGTDAPTLEPDPVAPTDVCSVAFFKGRVYAVAKGTNRIWYTQGIASDNQSLRLPWEGFIDVRRTGDPIIAIQDVGSELIVFKSATVESYYYSDEMETIRPTEGSLQEHGLMAPRAFRLIGDSLYFLTDNQQVAKIENRSVHAVSTIIDSFVRQLDVVMDAFVVQVDRYLLFQFPTIDKTLVFDTMIGCWYQWSDFSQSKHKMFPVNCSTYQPGSKVKWLLGNVNCSTYFLDDRVCQDDGVPIRFSVQSPHYDYETHNKKLATRMTAKIALSSVKANNTGGSESGSVPNPMPFAPATRCQAYSFTFPDYSDQGYTIEVSGLPSGLTFNSTTRTVSGTVPCQSGNFPVVVYMIDDRGARYRFDRTLSVSDFDITLTFGI